MKAVITIAIGLILSTSSVHAGNCSKHNALEAMSCQVGYTWDDEKEACVQAPQA